LAQSYSQKEAVDGVYIVYMRYSCLAVILQWIWWGTWRDTTNWAHSMYQLL